MGTFADYNGLQGNALFPMPPISNAPNEAANAPFPGISLDTSTGLNFGPETMGGIGLSEPSAPPQGVPLGQPPDVAGTALMNAPAARPGRGFAGAFGDAATAFGLGLQGRNPMEAMSQRAEIERRQRQTQLAEHTEFMKAIDFGVQKLQSLTGEDRANFIASYGRQLDELKPGLSETMKAMAKRPDISALLGKYGDADVVKAHLALDPSGRSFREALTKPEFHKQVEAQLDQKALPIVGRKLDLMRQRWQQFTPPEKVKEYMADGVLDATELMKINAELENHPEEKYRALALSPAEMQVWERQHEGISKSLGIVSPDSAARIREKNLGRDPNAGAKILVDGAGNPWIVRPDGTGAPLKTGAAPAAQPVVTPTSATPPVAAETPPGGMQVTPEVQAQRDQEAALIRARETQPNGGGAIPTAAVVNGSAQPPAAPQFVPKPKEEKLVAVRGTDGQVTYVPQSQAVGKQVGGRVNDQNLPKVVQALGHDFEKAGLPSMIAVVDRASKITPAQAEYITGWKANIPDPSVDQSVRDARQDISKLFNMTLKDRSGAAVTNQELDRLKKEFGQGLLKSPQSLITAIGRVNDIVEAHYAGIAAGHGKAALDSYNENLKAIGGLPFVPRAAKKAEENSLLMQADAILKGTK